MELLKIFQHSCRRTQHSIAVAQSATYYLLACYGALNLLNTRSNGNSECLLEETTPGKCIQDLEIELTVHIALSPKHDNEATNSGRFRLPMPDCILKKGFIWI